MSSYTGNLYFAQSSTKVVRKESNIYTEQIVSKSRDLFAKHVSF